MRTHRFEDVVERSGTRSRISSAGRPHSETGPSERLALRNDPAVWRQMLEQSESRTRPGSWCWDLDSGECVLSSRARHILGVEAEEVASSFDVMRARLGDEGAAQLAALARQTLEAPAGAVRRGLFEIGGANGHQEVLIALRHASGAGRFCVIGTLLGRRQLEELHVRIGQPTAPAAERAVPEPDASRELIGRLAAGVVHDVNNLVQIIELEAQAILDEDETEESSAHAHAGAILEVNQRAQVLMRRLLSLRRRAHAERVHANVTVHLERLRPVLVLTLGDRFPLEMDLQVRAPEIELDPAQLEQMILNLVVNARDASTPGAPITIVARDVHVQGDQGPPPAEGMPPGHYCVIQVSDRGSGMTPEQQQRAFEPFYSTKGERGTGLGLATVKEVMELHRGFVALQSRPGHGTTVSLYLPVRTDSRAYVA